MSRAPVRAGPRRPRTVRRPAAAARAGVPPAERRAAAPGRAEAARTLDFPPSCVCATPLPSGWTRVGFATSRSTTCPTGYDPLDVIEGATAQAGACTCGTACSVVDPDCSTRGIDTYVDTRTTDCGQLAFTLANVPAGQCDDGGSSESSVVSSHLRLTPPPPVGGSCSVAPTVNRTNVASAAE